MFEWIERTTAWILLLMIFEHAGSVLTRALQGGLDFAHHQEISHVFRVASSLYFFDHGLILLQKYLYFLLKHIRARTKLMKIFVELIQVS